MVGDGDDVLVFEYVAVVHLAIFACIWVSTWLEKNYQHCNSIYFTRIYAIYGSLSKGIVFVNCYSSH